MNSCRWFRTKTRIVTPHCTVTFTGEMICCAHPALAFWAGLYFVLPRESSHAKSCYHILKHYPHQSAFRIAWQQATDDMPLWTKHDIRAEFSCQTPMPPACLCWLCWDCLTMSCYSTRGVFSTLQTGLCSLPLAWSTFDEPVYLFVWGYVHHHNCWLWTFFVLFFRSRPRRNMLETSSRLKQGWNNTESPLCHHFILQIQAGICVIHARSWRNTLSF